MSTRAKAITRTDTAVFGLWAGAVAVVVAALFAASAPVLFQIAGLVLQ